MTAINTAHMCSWSVSVIPTLTGTNFADRTRVWITNGTDTITATDVIVESSTKITCTIDPRYAASGSWDIVVCNPDGQSCSLTGAVIMDETFIEDWASGLDGWIDDQNPGGDTYNANSGYLSMRAVSNWEFYDGLHYEFAPGFKPDYIRFRIRKPSNNDNQVWISLGDGVTGNTVYSERTGAIFYRWMTGRDLQAVVRV